MRLNRFVSLFCFLVGDGDGEGDEDSIYGSVSRLFGYKEEISLFNCSNSKGLSCLTDGMHSIL